VLISLSETTRLMTRTQAFFILLGAVNSELSFLADVANQERIREYDYGPGAGASFELYLLRKSFPLLSREVKPWPGTVDVEKMPGDSDEVDEADGPSEENPEA